jgi:hypothetical protein
VEPGVPEQSSQLQNRQASLGLHHLSRQKHVQLDVAEENYLQRLEKLWAHLHTNRHAGLPMREL